MAKRSSDDATERDQPNPAAALLTDYLNDLKAVRATGAGVPETSYYAALSNLFNAVGKTLKPKVRCLLTLTGQGAGFPDGGLFTADQFQRQSPDQVPPGQLPARGAIEVKGAKPELAAIIAGDQVRKYLDRYGIVIVTNLRGFAIVERDTHGRPQERESFSLAANETEFWQRIVAHPRAAAALHGEQFAEFLKRACLHAAPLANPKDVAWFLASYARDALFRVELHKELPALLTVRTALEEALGMQFIAEKGEHFFRSTLVQTLFYGVFSAWVLWHKENPGPQARFDWRTAEWSLHVPFIRTLYEEVAKPSRLGPLGLVEVLDWGAAVLNRVERSAFFKNFEDQHAVQYFYEPFLEAYDPELRKELGVWYTPPEIVRYQVARVDHVLRTELDLPDGLADPNVIVLDPCCGTGAYLVEVLKQIEKRLREKHYDALIGNDIKQAAMKRVFGFEIMPAPFVIAHLQLGLLLQKIGAPFSIKKNERAGVYLTNALTGWEPPKGKAKQSFYEELQKEREAADDIKRTKKILVVIGNPPYNAYAGISPAEEEGLVEVYKGLYYVDKKSTKRSDGSPAQVRRYKLNDSVKDGGWGIKKFNLDDLYVRFFRLAERRIAEMSGQGVVSFISNFSYLSDPSFVIMRERFLQEFDKLWLDCLNGDSRETGKLTPTGEPDPSVFSTDYNHEGIRVGTAVCVIVRKSTRLKKPAVRFKHFWGKEKREELETSLRVKRIDASYKLAEPSIENRYSFLPEEVAEHYEEWPNLIEFCALSPSNGLMEKRGGSLIDIDRESLANRMSDYFNQNISWQEYQLLHTALCEEAAGFTPPKAREKALKAGSFQSDQVQRYALRPFETRWCYYTAIHPLWNRARPPLKAQNWTGNSYLITRPAGVAKPEGFPISFTRCLGDNDYQRGHAYYFPLQLRNGKRLTKEDHETLFDLLGDRPSNRKPTANLSKAAREYLKQVNIKEADEDIEVAALIWMHTLAIGYSPAYLTENADGIRRDWPRIPLPQTKILLETSAALGEQIAALLDTETDVSTVTSGKLSPLMKFIGNPVKVGGGRFDPNSSEFAITAGWGHFGKAGVTMPAKGRLAHRPWSDDERAAIAAEAQERGLSPQEAERLLGQQTCDV